jgi:hypothetical protein
MMAVLAAGPRCPASGKNEIEPTFTATPSTETVPETGRRGLAESHAGRQMMSRAATRRAQVSMSTAFVRGGSGE